MTTVGYGDISAATIAERTMAIVGMILANFVFSGIMGRMSLVVDKLNDQNKAKNERMDEVSLFLQDCHLPKALQLTLTSFYRRQELKSYNFPKCAAPPVCCAALDRLLLRGTQTVLRCRLLAVLPYRMRLTVILSVFQSVIERVPFLRDHVDDAPFLIEVLSRCSKTRFSASSLARMQQAATGELEEACGHSHHACLYAAGTFDSEIYIVSRCVPCMLACGGVATPSACAVCPGALGTRH